MTKEKIILMDSELHPIGTLMYADSTVPGNDANWRPHRNIWRVIAHRECQPFPFAPVIMACEIEIVLTEDIPDD